MQFGSLNNLLLSKVPEPELVVGTGATLLSWTDRSPATLIEVNQAKRYIVVQEDKYERIGEVTMSESQQYNYYPDPDGQKYIFRKNKKNQWVQCHFNPKTKRLVKCGGYVLAIGFRERYFDYSF